jgi:hypothetical protein
MGPVLTAIIWILVGFVAGLVAPIWFWRRQLWKLDLIWRMNFANCVNQAVAQFFGGTVKDGVIYMPGHGPDDDELPPDDKDKLN